MNRTFFLTYWVFTCAITAIFLSLIALFVPNWAAIMGLNWASFLFFALFCFLMFEISTRSIHSENKQLFGQIFLISIGLKMFAAIIMFIIFIKKVAVFPRAAVLSFMLVYAIFSIFEVIFMNKLALNKHNNKQ